MSKDKGWCHWDEELYSLVCSRCGTQVAHTAFEFCLREITETHASQGAVYQKRLRREQLTSVASDFGRKTKIPSHVSNGVTPLKTWSLFSRISFLPGGFVRERGECWWKPSTTILRQHPLVQSLCFRLHGRSQPVISVPITLRLPLSFIWTCSSNPTISCCI